MRRYKHMIAAPVLQHSCTSREQRVVLRKKTEFEMIGAAGAALAFQTSLRNPYVPSVYLAQVSSEVIVGHPSKTA
jgi:hypothetical protein